MVDAPNQVRLREIQLVVAAIDKDPLAVEQGSHCAVAQDGRLFHPRQEVSSHCIQNTRGLGLLHPGGKHVRPRHGNSAEALSYNPLSCI